MATSTVCSSILKSLAQVMSGDCSPKELAKKVGEFESELLQSDDIKCRKLAMVWLLTAVKMVFVSLHRVARKDNLPVDLVLSGPFTLTGQVLRLKTSAKSSSDSQNLGELLHLERNSMVTSRHVLSYIVQTSSSNHLVLGLDETRLAEILSMDTILIGLPDPLEVEVFLYLKQFRKYLALVTFEHRELAPIAREASLLGLQKCNSLRSSSSDFSDNLEPIEEQKPKVEPDNQFRITKTQVKSRDTLKSRGTKAYQLSPPTESHDSLASIKETSQNSSLPRRAISQSKEKSEKIMRHFVKITPSQKVEYGSLKVILHKKDGACKSSNNAFRSIKLQPMIPSVPVVITEHVRSTSKRRYSALASKDHQPPISRFSPQARISIVAPGQNQILCSDSTSGQRRDASPKQTGIPSKGLFQKLRKH